ncbi:uncharacterized protein LOC125033914 isoform X2 [Penaeus chinensis]|uniref:uncharacterized protein LOC125033914 isoform X2 n=1 Tax=Penaeus chinensis TaxID=139456 RepID=UPI001FB5F9C0|nr:uncharacterized protein LOC125033914 isoform X2 [Penaeus chinensis]
MDDTEADIKVEAGGEGTWGVRPQDPLLVPTAVLLARREVPTRYPRATINQLHRATEETLVYRQHAQLSCQLPGAPKSTFLMVFSPDGSKVASTHGDHNIYVSEVKTGRCICTLEGHPRTPWCVAFHPASNEIIASGCLGGEVRVWDLKGGSEVWTTEKNTVIASLAFHPTDQVLVIATFNEIYFWDWFQPHPFAKISTADEKEKVRYVKFDPLGHKLITGIANTSHDRQSHGASRTSGCTNGSFPSHSELVEREQQLSHRYNQLSSQYLNLMSRYEALTSRNFNNVSRTSSRIDRGTDPIDPPPTQGQQALLNQARQFARQVTEERRATLQSQESTGEMPRNRTTWGSQDSHSGRDSQATSDLHVRLEEDYGLSAVRTLRQIISDDSASSSSLDSSSSATSSTSGISERNTRLSLLWTSRLHRPGQDSDSAGEASSVQSLWDNAVSGMGDLRAPMGGEEGVTGSRRGDNFVLDRRNYRRTEDRGSDEDDVTVGPAGLNLRSTGSQSERQGTLWGYFTSNGSVIQPGRSRVPRESRSETEIENSGNNTTENVIGNDEPENSQERTVQQRVENNGAPSSDAHILSQSTGTAPPTRGTDPVRLSNTGEIPPSDANEDLAVPGPSGLSGMPRSQMSSLSSATRYPRSSSLDPQFGVQLLSRHIENMQRICRAHLEITRHRHEILRLQQIRSMLYDIQHQIHSLRVSVDQSMEDLNGPSADSPPTTSQRVGIPNEDDPSAQPPSLGSSDNASSLPLIRHWSRTSPRTVARLQRGPFGTRTRSRHSHRPWVMSPCMLRRIPRRRAVRTRLTLPGLSASHHGASGALGGGLDRTTSPTRGLIEPGASASGTGAVIGPLPTPPPDQGDSEEQPRDIVRIISGNQYGAHTRTILHHSFERLQERLRERQEALEQQERRLQGFLNASSPASSTTSSVTSSASQDHEEDPPSPPEQYRRAGPPTTSLASRIANMIAHQVANGASTSTASSDHEGTNNQTETSETPTTMTDRSATRALNRNTSGSTSRSPASSTRRPTHRSSDRPLSVPDRPPVEPSSSSFDRLNERRLSGRSDGPYDRLSDRWSDLDNNGLPLRSCIRQHGRNSERLSERTMESASPWGGLPPSRMSVPPGPPPTVPPPLPQLDETEAQSNDLNNNSSPWHNARRRLRQDIMNARRDSVGRLPGNSGGPVRLPMAALRSRHITTERILLREGLRRERRDRYRQILQRMADRLNSLVNQEQEQQQQRQQERHQSSDSAEGEQDSSSSSMDNHMQNLRLLVRLALNLIYQLLNFICNQNISYEERPISRLPNPFRDEELGAIGERQRGDLPPPMSLDLEPGLHNLTTLLETVRMASEELRNDGVGGSAGEPAPPPDSTRPITNVPRRLTDFLRRSGTLARQQDQNNRQSGWSGSSGANTPRPHLVIPRITLSDPNGSESQVEEENAAAALVSSSAYNDAAEFSTRSVAGVPLRVLGRQYAVDRRSPDSEDSPGPPDGVQEGPSQPSDPLFPWRGLAPYESGPLRGAGADMSFRPNLTRAPPDRAAERESDNFFSRPYFAQNFAATRNMSASVVTHRIQAWDFTHYNIPEISDSAANVVVRKCKIHNDASVDISIDGTMLAALVPESQAMTMVGVYSLREKSRGQLLYSYIFAPNTICVSLSPVARHLVVGFASHTPRFVSHHNTKQVVAQIYKLCDNPMFYGRGQAGHLQFLRDIEVMSDHRHTSLNCIRWLPYPGQGLIYGTNRGQLNILR